jgi:DNA mismatch endonuclease (patch repair protein)
MAAIRSGNTKPELFVRRSLHAAGFRFRLHAKDLPGKPDIVLPRYRAVVFVHGCFWHQHDCHLFKWPSTRKDFWAQKISRNAGNDKLALAALLEQGWRVAIVWECALKGRHRLEPDAAMRELVRWVRTEEATLDIRGKSG